MKSKILVSEEDEEIRYVENLVLLILGNTKGKLSVLHLQKIFFFLWKFHPVIKELIDFTAHYKGPYSFDLEEVIKSPQHLYDCWKYISPRKGSKVEEIFGGYIELTLKGQKLFKELFEKLTKKAKLDEDALVLLSAIKFIVPLYASLTWDELLLLLYTDQTNKEYSQKSILSKEILNRSEIIVEKLVKRNNS